MKKIIQPLLVLVGCWALWACGGSGNDVGSSATRGKVGVSITWPDRNRIIPDGADNIKVTITSVTLQTDGVTPLVTVTDTFARPAPGNPTTATRSYVLPVGRYLATAIAYSGVNEADLVATPTAVADFTVTAGNTSTFTITLESVIESVAISGAGSLTAGETRTLTAAALDGSASNVMVLPANMIWRSNSPNVVFVNPATNAVLGTETTGLTATVMATQNSGSATVTASLRPNRESDDHFEDSETLNITGMSFGAASAVTPDLGTRTFVGNPASRASLLVDETGGFSFGIGENGGTTPFIAISEVDTDGTNALFSDQNIGDTAALDNAPSDLEGVLGAGVDTSGVMFVHQQRYAIDGGGGVVADTIRLQRFIETGGAWSEDTSIASVAGSMTVFNGTGNEVLLLDTGGVLQRFAVADLTSAGTDNLGAFLTGMNLSRTSIGVTTDKKLYVGAPLSAGGSSKIVGINIAGAPAGLVFAQAPTVVGEITGLAVSSDHIFVISHVNNSFKLSAFRRDTGVLVTETALAPTANPFVPYRIAASAGGTVYVFGAEITGGNTYHFRVFEVTLS